MYEFHHNIRIAPPPPPFGGRPGGGLLIFLILLFAGCSDDFLDDTINQPQVSSAKILYITPASGYMEYEVTVPNAGNNDYSIGKLPQWLVFKYYKGSFKNDVVTLKFTVQNVITSFDQGTYVNELVLIIQNTGIYIIPVYMVNE